MISEVIDKVWPRVNAYYVSVSITKPDATIPNAPSRVKPRLSGQKDIEPALFSLQNEAQCSAGWLSG